MNPILRNILAVVAGLLIGGAINSLIILMSGSLIAPPSGVDVNDVESIRANIHLYEPKHFLMPFLAHAIGTLVGAFAAIKIGANNHMRLGLIVAVFFLVGGIIAATMIPAPTWFIALDLVIAYLPMAYIAYKLS
ncbi:MAG: hypothetical protein HOP11_10125 [Saprospiraceae bacterium]|nr:hypothetical protein [Saprospiraceae bacterium]